MLQLEENTFNVIQRCLTACNCETIDELSIILETTPGKIKEITDSESYFPAKWLALLLTKKDINPFWLLSGKGLVKINEIATNGGDSRKLIEE